MRASRRKNLVLVSRGDQVQGSLHLPIREQVITNLSPDSRVTGKDGKPLSANPLKDRDFYSLSVSYSL